MLTNHVHSNRSNVNLLKMWSIILLFLISLSSRSYAVDSDFQINDLITKAIETYPSVEAARFDQQATVENISAAKLNLLPTPSVTSGYGEDDFNSQVRIRQPLWTGGRLTANVNQAVFNDKAATERVYEQQNQVAKSTIEAWQSYIQAIARQHIHLDSLDQLNEFEQMMQRRVGQGVSARIELDLAINRILQEQNAYQAAVEQQRIAAARLEQIIGHPLPQARISDIKTLTEQAKRQSTGFEDMAFNQASFYNPTVVKEHFQIESAKQEVEVQRAARYPTIYAQYEHSYYQQNDRNDLRDRDDGVFSIGLTYDPGAGFSNLALARASQAQVNSLVQNQQASRRRVIEEIQIQYQQFVSARDRETSLVAAAAGAQIVVNSYRRQFIAGRKSWLEVLNAVREHNEYQVQLVQARADMLGAFYKLQVDFGLMDWQRFARNREPVPLFKPLDPVREWLDKQNM
ncbi:TolC family protein [uncultured Psychrobacter sp.]|uniref:TolC family protein n=1 Tax=uncultured Psychrobacter sp. TaxID=259303 RepID=UPI0034599DF3